MEQRSFQLLIGIAGLLIGLIGLIIELIQLLVGDGLLRGKWDKLIRSSILKKMLNFLLIVAGITFIIWTGLLVMRRKEGILPKPSLAPLDSPTASVSYISPTLTATPIGEAGSMEWYLYPQPAPQPPERVPQHGFFFPTTHPEQVKIEVFPPRTKRISAIYHPLSSLQEIGFTIDVEGVQGDMKLWIGVVKKAPLPVPSGRFFKVWQSQEETRVGVGQYYGVIGDWYPVQTEHFQGSIEIGNGFLTFHVEGVPEKPLSLPVSDEYALYLGYEAGENSSFSAIVNFTPRGAP